MNKVQRLPMTFATRNQSCRMSTLLSAGPTSSPSLDSDASDPSTPVGRADAQGEREVRGDRSRDDELRILDHTKWTWRVVETDDVDRPLAGAFDVKRPHSVRIAVPSVRRRTAFLIDSWRDDTQWRLGIAWTCRTDASRLWQAGFELIRALTRQGIAVWLERVDRDFAEVSQIEYGQPDPVYVRPFRSLILASQDRLEEAIIDIGDPNNKAEFAVNWNADSSEPSLPKIAAVMRQTALHDDLRSEWDQLGLGSRLRDVLGQMTG